MRCKQWREHIWEQIWRDHTTEIYIHSQIKVIHFPPTHTLIRAILPSFEDICFLSLNKYMVSLLEQSKQNSVRDIF